MHRRHESPSLRERRCRARFVYVGCCWRSWIRVRRARAGSRSALHIRPGARRSPTRGRSRPKVMAGRDEVGRKENGRPYCGDRPLQRGALPGVPVHRAAELCPLHRARPVPCRASLVSACIVDVWVVAGSVARRRDSEMFARFPHFFHRDAAVRAAPSARRSRALHHAGRTLMSATPFGPNATPFGPNATPS